MEYNPLPIFCTIKPSFIHGLGLFATREIKKDTELGLSHIEVDDVLYRNQANKCYKCFYIKTEKLYHPKHEKNDNHL